MDNPIVTFATLHIPPLMLAVVILAALAIGFVAGWLARDGV